MIMMFSFLVDTNLIQLDTDDMATNSNTYADNDDDLIFEVGNSTQGKYLDGKQKLFSTTFFSKIFTLELYTKMDWPSHEIYFFKKFFC